MDRGQLTMPFSEANIYPRLSLCRNRGSVMFSFSLSARFVNNGGHTTRPVKGRRRRTRCSAATDRSKQQDNYVVLLHTPMHTSMQYANDSNMLLGSSTQSSVHGTCVRNENPFLSLPASGREQQ